MSCYALALKGCYTSHPVFPEPGAGVLLLGHRVPKQMFDKNAILNMDKI